MRVVISNRNAPADYRIITDRDFRVAHDMTSPQVRATANRHHSRRSIIIDGSIYHAVGTDFEVSVACSNPPPSHPGAAPNNHARTRHDKNARQVVKYSRQQTPHLYLHSPMKYQGPALAFSAALAATAMP